MQQMNDFFSVPERVDPPKSKRRKSGVTNEMVAQLLNTIRAKSGGEWLRIEGKSGISKLVAPIRDGLIPGFEEDEFEVKSSMEKDDDGANHYYLWVRTWVPGESVARRGKRKARNATGEPTPFTTAAEQAAAEGELDELDELDEL